MPFLQPSFVSVLTQSNPWWGGGEMRELPITRRHLVGQIHRRFTMNLAPIVVVRGSRQIGKTTACEQVITDFLKSGIAPKRILRVQFDDVDGLHEHDNPILRIVNWYEKNILRQTLNEAAHQGEKAFLFFDEVQNLRKWSEQLKFLVDTSTTQILVTGSSALRLERGRDSLAGRITTIEAGVLSLTEIGALRQMNPPEPYLPDNGLSILKKELFWRGLKDYGEIHKLFRNEAFRFFSQVGVYPLAHIRPNVPWEALADQLNETIVKRVIQHDLRLGEKGRRRDGELLEEIFRICCRYAGQSPSLNTLADELQQSLSANIGPARVRANLNFLAETLLIRLVNPLEIRLKKQRSNAKICLVDHALRASWLQERINLIEPANESEAMLAGYIAESTVGIVLSAITNLDIAWLPAKDKNKEVDFVMILGNQRIPIEVKYRNTVRQRDLQGIIEFLDNSINQASFGIVITKNDGVTVEDKRLICMPLSTFMLLR
jgi:predicted AAA+ superfamily ATPase